jgi:hypothetical protein
MSHYHKLLQRSPGGVSSILNISGVRIVEESTKTPPPPGAAGSAYPADWAWSVRFAGWTGGAQHIEDHPWNGNNQISGRVISDEADGIKYHQGIIKGGTVFEFAFRPSAVPSANKSADEVVDGMTDPNGNVIDFSDYKFMTFYFKYLNVVDQPTDFMNHVYWSVEDVAEPQNNSFGSAGNLPIIRRSLTPFGDTPTTPIAGGQPQAGGTDFVDNEYISVCYDMSINSGAAYTVPEARSWPDMGVGNILEHIGSIHFHGGGESSELLFYGAVLSKIDNTNESIYNPTLPIALVV